MASWKGTREIAIVSACMNPDGTAEFALNEVEVTAEEAANGVHYYLVEADLLEAGFDEPFVHFAEDEAPPFLHAAVRQYLGLSPRVTDCSTVASSEDQQ
jgi:hypothetical protein